jgi:transposase-like protein
MPYRELNFDEHNVAFAMSEVKDLFRMHFERGCQYVAKRVYNKILAIDFDSYINASRHERTSKRRGQRNGYRTRSLLTSVGQLELTVPRDREGKYHSNLFKAHKRIDKSLDEVIRSMFLSGVSTRKVGDILDVLCGHRVSPSYVSTVNKELDRAVREFANSPIADDFVFLFLDALTVKVRFELKARPVKLLVAYGIRRDGHRELISYQRANSESTACWRSFLDNLYVRGLKAKHLKLIVMDGAAGLWAAVGEVYPLIKHQLCWVHKLRNVANYCPARYREECVSQAAQIMRAASSTMAAKLFRQWKRCWTGKIPRAVKCLERDFERLIAVFSFPKELRKMLRTTNVIERCFREVRRRLKVMGYFQNSQSCDRIIYALFTYFNKKWKRTNQRIHNVKTLTTKAA